MQAVTIEAIFEVNCDGCMDGFVENETGLTKGTLWEYLKGNGWKRRKLLIWCPVCVKQGVYAKSYVDWMTDEREAQGAEPDDEACRSASADQKP